MDDTSVVSGGAGDEKQPVVATQDAAGESNDASGRSPATCLDHAYAKV
jgi:hypothetical protein